MSIDIPDGYYEFIHITVRYPCEHVMLRTVRRDSATKRQNEGKDREIFVGWPERCGNCQVKKDTYTLGGKP